jgi:hypothetical protein
MPRHLTPQEHLYTIMSTYKVDKARADWRRVMKWNLDLWYELWDRAGSRGLDTWYDLRDEARDGPDTGHAPDAGPDVIEDGREGT